MWSESAVASAGKSEMATFTVILRMEHNREKSKNATTRYAAREETRADRLVFFVPSGSISRKDTSTTDAQGAS
jgi:hypothetical protein